MTQQHPNAPVKFGFSTGQDSWGSDMNTNLVLLAALANCTAVTITNTLPGSPIDYEIYVLGDSPSGAGTGHAKALAYHQPGGWEFIAPRDGWRVWVRDAGVHYTYQFARWVADSVTVSFIGTWVTGYHYPLNGIVLRNGIAYLCIHDHTSGAFDADVASKYWTIYQGVAKRGSYSNRITVIGSSVPYGSGATNDYGYMQRLADALESYTVTNVSIGGNNTWAVIDRFYRDVIPTDPDIVIVALSLGNEGLHEATDKAALTDQYIANMLRLANMIHQIGAKPILTGAYPRNDYTATDYKYLKQTNQILENSKVPYLNLLGAIDDGAGHWKDGMWWDSGHPNDVGHESMFRAIPLSLFDNLTYGEDLAPMKVDPSYVVRIGTQVSTVPAIYHPESPFGCVTAMCTVRRNPGNLGRAFIAFNSTEQDINGPLRVRNQADFWKMSIGDVDAVVSSRLSSDQKQTHICVRSEFFTKAHRHSLFIDGALIGSYVQDIGTVTSITFAGRQDAPSVNADACEFGSFAIWRTALSDEQIFDAANGIYSKASLCLLSIPSESDVGSTTRMVNLAPSKTYLRWLTDDVTAVAVPSKTKEVRRLDDSIADLQALNAQNFDKGEFIPAIIAPGASYAVQQGWWCISGDIFHFEIYMIITSAPASTLIQINMPQPCVGRPLFKDVRYIGTLDAGSEAYAYMNYDGGTSILNVSQRLPSGPPVQLYCDTGADMKITGSYRFR